MKEIANTEFLASVHHNYDKFAKQEVFDVSRKWQTKKIYSATEVSGSRIIINTIYRASTWLAVMKTN